MLKVETKVKNGVVRLDQLTRFHRIKLQGDYWFWCYPNSRPKLKTPLLYLTINTMSDFTSNELRTIDLGNNKFVKIPVEISFGEAEKVSKSENVIETTLLEFIKEWNLKDENGVVAEISLENIKRLKIEDVNVISKELSNLIEVKKKDESEERKQQERLKEKVKIVLGQTI